MAAPLAADIAVPGQVNLALVRLADWVAVMPEIWLPLPGFPGYDVSDQGRVRSFWRTSSSGRLLGGWTQVIGTSPRILGGGLDKDGYKTVTLRRDGRSHRKRVHRLVAEVFVMNDRPRIAVVTNHKNNISHDNRRDNLEWNTVSENTLHANEIGVGGRGERHGSARLKAGDVRAIRADCVDFTDCRRWAAKLGMSPQNIDRIMKRQTWRHV